MPYAALKQFLTSVFCTEEHSQCCNRSNAVRGIETTIFPSNDPNSIGCNRSNAVRGIETPLRSRGMNREDVATDQMPYAALKLRQIYCHFLLTCCCNRSNAVRGIETPIGRSLPPCTLRCNRSNAVRGIETLTFNQQ